jgi:molybdopterin-biosynthesis enzyme MoeA-like protein
MPAQYEAIRDKLVQRGMPLAEAKKHAAMIYNSKHKKNPVGRYSD